MCEQKDKSSFKELIFKVILLKFSILIIDSIFMQLLCKQLRSPGYKMAQLLCCVPLTNVHEALMKICYDLIVLGVMVVLTKQL
jgi:hypothetical protein